MPKTFEFVKYIFITMFNAVLLVAIITTRIILIMLAIAAVYERD